MNSKVDKWLDEHQAQIIEALQGCIRFRSLKAQKEEGAPFGKDIKLCLDYMLSKGEELGFSTKDLQGYAGCIDYGNFKETLGILSHLDVVPEGTGWDFEPYGAEISEDKLYGRGTLDDKGPAVAALFALKAIKECGIPMKRNVRIILGCDEESGMECLKYYKEHEPIPELSFSPDGEYPLTNSEKSIVNTRFERKFDSSITIESGQVCNIVPGVAEAFVPLDIEDIQPIAEAYSDKSECGLVLTDTEEGTNIKVMGEFSHASMPEDGKNALQALIGFLAELPLGGEDEKIVKALNKSFGMEYYGETIGLDKKDDSGRLTLNIGVMHWNSQGFAITFDLRCPTSLPEQEIKDKLLKAMGDTGAEQVSWLYKPGYCLPDDCEIVSKLMAAFKERTGEDMKPKRIGGGTYARTLPNAVSFGPEGYLCQSSAHMANEYITIPQLMFNAKMIADAIIALAAE